MTYFGYKVEPLRVTSQLLYPSFFLLLQLQDSESDFGN